MEEFSREKIEKLKEYDFFGRNNNSKDFESDIKTNLICGKHKEDPPFVTILITTYRRPDTLKYAIESAIHQEGFSDYEIIVSDNSGEECYYADTEKLVRSFQCDKLIYYRHEKTMVSKSTRAVNLVKTKWLCFLHDDDVLASNHLRVMSHIIRNNPQIAFLGGKMCAFTDKLDAIIDYKRLTQAFHGEYLVEYLDYKSYNYGFVGTWLGAFIDREKFLLNGAMDDLTQPMIGDYIMVAKYAYYYGTYLCDAPLYGYRIWENQVSSSSAITWQNCYTTEYYLYKYISCKRNYLFRPFFCKLSKYKILEKVQELTRGPYKFHIKMERFKEICEVDKEDIHDKEYAAYIALYDYLHKYRKKLLMRYAIRGKIN